MYVIQGVYLYTANQALALTIRMQSDTCFLICYFTTPIVYWIVYVEHIETLPGILKNVTHLESYKTWSSIQNLTYFL